MYDEFRKARVLIGRELRKRGWELFGWKEDESDSMTDYYSPENWNGIGTKAGYTVVIDDSSGYYSGRNITKWADGAGDKDTKKVYDKILKLRRMTMANNASESEESTAREKIRLLEKELKEQNKAHGLVVVGQYPEYQPNPRGAKWHVEKDGVIYAKGTGISKFSTLYYFDPEESPRLPRRDEYETEERFQEVVEHLMKAHEEKLKLYKSLQTCVQKIDAAAGGTIGKGTPETYKKVLKTKSISNNVAVDIPMPKRLKSGMYFQLKQSFSNGCYRGYVYRITTVDDSTLMSVRMDKKLRKELTGWSNSANFFNVNTEKFKFWVEKGFISMVEITEEVGEEQYAAYIKA